MQPVSSSVKDKWSSMYTKSVTKCPTRSSVQGGRYLIVCGYLLIACSSGVQVYPQSGFEPGSLPPKPPEQVEVIFGESVPTCRHRDLGTLLYDAFSDRSSRNKSMVSAIKQAKEEAGRIGADGIYRVVLQPAGSAGVGLGVGLPVTGLNMSLGVSMSENRVLYNLSAVPYVCEGPGQERTPSGGVSAGTEPAASRAQPLSASSQSCPGGQLITEDSDGHCCWPGQTWHATRRKCIGLPSCPRDMSVDVRAQTCVASECGGGRVRAPDAVHCCFPGQAWSKSKRSCAGVPESCPAGTRQVGEQCVGQALCEAGMSYLPAGQVHLSYSDQVAQVSALCMDQDEVSVAAYQACVQSGACTPPSLNADDKYCNYGRADRSRHSVNCVTRVQAEQYCNTRGQRLPTEAEWEWAASSLGQVKRYVWGDTPPQKGDACWHEYHGASTCAAGSYSHDTSQQQVRDLAANLHEWVGGTGSDLVARGGAWSNGEDDDLLIRRRIRNPRSSWGRVIGFRCVKGP